MRAVPTSLDPEVVSEIDRRLGEVEARHEVRIAWAIESGSRAWGFPSPDSDYDCRFIFIRPRDRYLSLWPARDVIETPLDAIFDVNGWDLAKAIRLLAKGNATAIEWLRSPIIYSGESAFRQGLLALAEEIAERGAIARHYLHVARQQQAKPATLKRFFYVLRPAMALRWLDDHPDQTIPPMDLPTLVAETSLSNGLADEVTELIDLKSRTHELGSGTPPAGLIRFVADQLTTSERYEALPVEKDDARSRQAADDLFLSQLS